MILDRSRVARHGVKRFQSQAKLLVFLPILCSSDFEGSITEEAPAFAQSVTDYFQSYTYLESVRACFPNSTSPFPQLAGPSLPQSQCLLAPEVAAELIEQLGGALVHSTLALEELNRISASGGSPNIVLESTWVSGFLRTLSEVYHGKNQFGRVEHGTAPLKLKVWQMLSPIAASHRLNDGQETKLILGDSCLDGSLSVKLGSSEQLRTLKAQEPNVSLVVASARISDSGAHAISGAFDVEIWENQLAAAAAKNEGLNAQGPLFPRTYLLLYYRTDWFEELGVSVPNTWDELIGLARTMSGLDGFVSTEGVGPTKVAGYESFESWPDPDSMPPEPIELRQVLPHEENMGGNNTRFALCLDLAPYCQGAYVLNAIMASMAQMHGTWQNAYMDPVEMELLSIKHPELMKEALQVFRNLAQASHLPTSLQSCSAVSHLFGTGRCAMTINWEYAFAFLYNSPRLDVPGTRNQGGRNSSEPHPAAASLVGKVGVSPLPGSSRVYDRYHRAVKECTPSTCPLATQDVIASYSRSTSDSSTNLTTASSSSSSSSSRQSRRWNKGGSGSESSSSTSSWGKQVFGDKSQEEQGGNSSMGIERLVVDEEWTAWVNRAPYSAYAPAILTLCNPSLDDQGEEMNEYQTNLIAAASRALNSMVLPLVALETSLSTFMGRKMASLGRETAVLAYTLAHKGNLGSAGEEQRARRQELLKPPDFSDQELESWWRNRINARGQTIDVINDNIFLDIADSRRFFQALWKASYGYQNQAPEFLATPTMTQAYRFAAAEVAFYTASSPTFSLQRAVQGFKVRSIDAQNAETADKQAIQVAVWRATAFDSSMIGAFSGSSSSKNGLSEQEMAGAVVGPVVLVFLAAILVIVLVTIRQRWNDRRNLLGVILPPKAGPQTTLLLTDIESSTQMWETLPEHVCDEAISVHHAVIRKQLHLHHGYECGTEGDAFVLAFHTVTDALVFAAVAQVELLLADWPAQLLELEVCRPVYVPLPSTPDRQQGTFMKHLRKSEARMSFDQQRDSGAALQDWQSLPQSQEAVLTLEVTSARTQLSSKRHSPQMQSTPEVSTRSTGRGFLSKLKGCFLCRTLQELQEQSRRPCPLNTPRLRTMEDADGSVRKTYAAVDTDRKTSPEGHQQKGKSSGLLAFDDALFSTALIDGLFSKQSKKSDEETGLDCTQLVKRFPSRFSIIAGPTGLGQGNHDPSRISQPCVSGPSVVNESSLIMDTSSSKLPAPKSAKAGQSSTRRVHFSTSQLELAMGHSRQEDSGLIDNPSTHHSIPESSRGSSMENTNLTVGQHFLATMPRTHTPGPGRLLVLRGLRVRMGAASGVERAEDVQLKGAQGRAQYSGPAMAAAKAVVDAAQGGMVLISPETFQQIPASLLQRKLLVASMGEHVLGKGQEQICMQLYQVLPRQLVHRAAQLGPVRSIHQLSHGFLEAPSNRAAICFMTVSYLKALEQWNPDVTAAALELWHTTVQGILIKRGGYLVEAADGLCLAAFPRPASAIRWALESIEACLHLHWPPELLETELGEEQHYTPFLRRSIQNNLASPSLQRTSPMLPQSPQRDPQVRTSDPFLMSGSFSPMNFNKVLLFRGLRLKVGIDWGAVKADLHAATARVTFRGRVMNRAARISSVAKCGQVWCSGGAWEAAALEINCPEAFPDETIQDGEDDVAAGVDTMMPTDEQLAGPKIQYVNVAPLGPYHLKGIAQDVELFHCY